MAVQQLDKDGTACVLVQIAGSSIQPQPPRMCTRHGVPPLKQHLHVRCGLQTVPHQSELYPG
jgi:hypothetical protein